MKPGIENKNINWKTMLGLFQIIIPIISAIVIGVFCLWVKGLDLKYEIHTQTVVNRELREYSEELPAKFFSFTDGKLLQLEVKTLGAQMEGMNALQKEMMTILREIRTYTSNNTTKPIITKGG